MQSNSSPFSLEYIMETTFDIFARLPDGKPIWMESVEGLGKNEPASTRAHSHCPE
jgi:hypothetical protein